MSQPGIEKLLKKGKKQFRIPENLNHYSDFDLKEAERKYLRFCIIGGQCPEQTVKEDHHHDTRESRNFG